ncbi:hypothetical protein B0O99DRAFT_745271 [Bisporella sp. PMI_857]|nr:hypothetical protein B0O99DRAFT_745271 [Bisporella sp. PMI_857]
MSQVLGNFKSKWFSWLSAFISLSIALTSYFYVKTVLINEAPPPSFLQLPPGRTLLTVNVFAHVVAFLIWDQVSTSLEALRWALASRQEHGLPLGSFLALSRATGPVAVASLMLLPRPGVHLFYCLKRLSFMGLAWVLGIVLTSNVEFKNIYTRASLQEAEVYAGLAPVSRDLLRRLSDSSMVHFFYMGLGYSLLSDNRFSWPVQPILCSGPSCSSFFLPGGAAWIRDQDDGNMLFRSPKWGNKEAILVQNAPGYHVEFYPPPEGWSFDKASDCGSYGETAEEGLYICLANYGTDLIAGWSVCPWDIYYGTGSCFSNTSWQDKIDQTTTLTFRKRHATMAYSGANFSILSMEYLSSPEVTTVLTAKDWKDAMSIILAPISQSVNASNPNWTSTATTSSIHYELGTGLRLYKLLYPGFEAPPLGLLYNFLSIPFQCSTGIYYATGDIPASLKTNATVVTPHYRAIAEPWVLTLYGAIAIFLSLWAIAVLFLACILGGEIPSASKFPEVDLISRYPAKTGKSPKAIVKPDDHDLGHLSQREDNKMGLLRKIRGWAAGKRGVLELISDQRIRFGLPIPPQDIRSEDENMARTFVTMKHCCVEEEYLRTGADSNGAENGGREDTTLYEESSTSKDPTGWSAL